MLSSTKQKYKETISQEKSKETKKLRKSFVFRDPFARAERSRSPNEENFKSNKAKIQNGFLHFLPSRVLLSYSHLYVSPLHKI